MNINALQIGIIGGGIAIVAFVIFALFIIERPEPSQIEFKDIELGIDLRLTNININETSITTTFSFMNPNTNTIILETVNYKLFANDIMVAASGIGERVEGAIVGSTGGTYYLVPQTIIDVQDNVSIKRVSSLENVWNDIQSNKVTWKVTGTYVILSPQGEGAKEYNFSESIKASTG